MTSAAGPWTQLSPAELQAVYDEALDCKAEGNSFFMEKSSAPAVAAYGRGISLFATKAGLDCGAWEAVQKSNNNDCKPKKGEAKQPGRQESSNSLLLAKCIDLLTILHSNTSQVHLDTRNYLNAVSHAAQARKFTPYHAKSMFRAVSAVCNVTKEQGGQDYKYMWWKALIICELAFKKLPKESSDPLQPLYSKLKRSSSVAMTTSLSLGCSHWVNGPMPFLCLVCRAVPDLSEDGVGSRCPCGSASFCCNAHKELAFDEKVGGHKNVCAMLGQACDSLSGEGDEPLVDYSKQKEPFSSMPFLQAVMMLFRQGMQRQENYIEYEQLRTIPLCVNCGSYPATSVCSGCNMVAVCKNERACQKRAAKVPGQEKGNTNNHSTEACKTFKGTAASYHQFWLTPQFFYPSYLDTVNSTRGIIRSMHHSSLVNKTLDAEPEFVGCSTPEAIIALLEEAVATEVSTKKTAGGGNAKGGTGSWGGVDLSVVGAAAKAMTTFRTSISPYFMSCMGTAEGELIVRQAPLQGAVREGDDATAPFGFRQLALDSYSWPLSIFYGVMGVAPQSAVAELKERLAEEGTGRLVIHVIGAELESRMEEGVWEELLHVFAGWKAEAKGSSSGKSKAGQAKEVKERQLIRHLDIVFVGPEVKQPGADVKVITNKTPVPERGACDGCEALGSTVTLHFSARTYEDFVSQELPKHRGGSRGGGKGKGATMPQLEPHLSCLFNAGLYNYVEDKGRGQFDGAGDWEPALKAMVNLPLKGCISVVTCYDISEATWDRKIVAGVVEKERKARNNSKKGGDKQTLGATVVSEPTANLLSSPAVKPDPTFWNGKVIAPSAYLFTIS